MLVEHHGWHSQRLGRGMGIDVYGHYGAPIVVFPTSGGDEHEYAGQGMIEALAHWIDAGRVKFFCINTVNNESWYDKGAHPRHRSYMQADVRRLRRGRGGAVRPRTTASRRASASPPPAASFGAYHAANTLFKHPDKFKRCLALSGVYDIRRFMDGDYDDNFYFNNPVDYVAGLSDPWYFGHLSSCDIRLVTGHGPYEDSGPTYRFSEILEREGNPPLRGRLGRATAGTTGPTGSGR